MKRAMGDRAINSLGSRLSRAYFRIMDGHEVSVLTLDELAGVLGIHYTQIIADRRKADRRKS